MLVIGLTGGIATGKSTVTRMLRELGARVIDADVVARQAVEPGAEAYAGVVQAFGPEVVGPDGQLDRRRLGERVFADPAARRRLEALVHPHVRRRMTEAVAAARDEGLPAVVLDIPLLIEGDQRQPVDRIWLVYVDQQTQRRRLRERDGLTPAEAEARLQAQLPIDAKVSYAHAVIDNGGSPECTRQQVEALWAQVLAGAH